MRRWFSVILVATLVSSLLLCLSSTSALAVSPDQHLNRPQAEKASKTLFQRLGGKKAITAVVDEFVTRVAADARINKFFAKTDIPKLKMHLVNQICEATAGRCKYTGRSMKEVHKGMGVSSADFTALVEDLVAALDKFKVGQKEKDELLAILGPMKTDIVQKP